MSGQKPAKGNCSYSLPIPMLDHQDGQNIKLCPLTIILATLPNPNEGTQYQLRAGTGTVCDISEIISMHHSTDQQMLPPSPPFCLTPFPVLQLPKGRERNMTVSALTRLEPELTSCGLVPLSPHRTLWRSYFCRWENGGLKSIHHS